MVYSHIYLRTSRAVPTEVVERISRKFVPRMLLAPPVSVQSKIDQHLVLPSLAARVASPIAILAVLLTAMGGFGIVSFASLMKRREMAIRSALGATRASVAYELSKFVAKPTIIGLVIGFVIVLLTVPFWKQALWNPKTIPYTTLVEGIGLILLLMFLATTVPIRRASKVDLLTIMRED